MAIRRRWRIVPLLVLFSYWAVAQSVPAAARAGATPWFEITFPASVHAEPITGRGFLVITGADKPEPRLQIGSWTQEVPIFGVDVSQLQPGEAAVIDATTLGYPLKSLTEIPAGDYYVQAVMNVYTEFPRADGHTIWAHMDQWEGQDFNASPGNLYSKPQRIHFDQELHSVKLELRELIPQVQVPPDSDWVKRIKFQSKLLSEFWGKPVYLGATILLPKEYDQHPNVRYPVIYEQDHFNLDPPLYFREERLEHAENELWKQYANAGFELQQQWRGPNFPRVIAVRFQHPTPYFDDSYAVNSANDGPYGDAIMQELIPYIEEHFRVIREPWARMLTGASTGGWESLALQVFHPDFFGGTWTFFPDPIDFRRYQLVNIYDDDNAFKVPGFQWVQYERPWRRTVEGQVLGTLRQLSQWEEVLGSHGRSGQQLDAWEAVYGPVGADGYPQPLWDKVTGKIDHTVALYMRDHGFDLDYYLQQNWNRVGPKLVDKIHIYCGDMDNYYLNLAVYKMQEVLQTAKSPAANATFEYGRPMKGHGWTPFSQVELVQNMVEFIAKHAPAGAGTQNWKY